LAEYTTNFRLQFDFGLSLFYPRLRFDLFDSCARYKFSSFIHSFIQTLFGESPRVEITPTPSRNSL